MEVKGLSVALFPYVIICRCWRILVMLGNIDFMDYPTDHNNTYIVIYTNKCIPCDNQFVAGNILCQYTSSL